MEPRMLKDLLAGLTYTVAENCSITEEALAEMEIPAVICDDRKLQEGCLFICCRYTNFNGPASLPEAVAAGAAVIVTERAIAEEAYAGVTAGETAGETPDPDSPVFIFVEDARYAMAFIYAAWYDHPADKLFTIAITGTKGKTTTSHMIYRMLNASGRKTGLLSTLEYIIGDEHIEALNATPEAELLQSTLYRMVQAGLDSVVMEISTIGLQFHRSQGMIFDFGIFTNIGIDHIGPGGAADFDHLIEYKGRLLKQCRTGLVNIDDPNIDRVLEGHTCALKTFGLSEKADYRASGIVYGVTDGRPGVSFDVPCADLHVSVSMPGEFTVYNSLAAIGTALQLGVPKEAILSALREFSLPGRFQIVRIKKAGADSAPTAIVDFAHNPISLQAILTTLRQYFTGRIICVFGCGGGGSNEKRPDMGRVSTELADFVIITSDNPRFEDPDHIVRDIVSGIPEGRDNYSVIPDRREAVFAAFAKAGPGDVVLLAGKGPEKYQLIRGKEYPCDDCELALEALSRGAEAAES